MADIKKPINGLIYKTYNNTLHNKILSTYICSYPFKTYDFLIATTASFPDAIATPLNKS